MTELRRLTVQSIEGTVSVVNSTVTPLAGDTGGSDHIFTGVSEDVKDFGMILVSVFADQASATDGLSVEFSPDGSNWDSKDVFNIPASTSKTFSFQPVYRYFRIVYTNGVAAQSVFRMQIQFKLTYVKPSSHRIQDGISTDDDAELVKAVLTGEDPDGHFHNIQATHDGNLTISDNSSGLSIAQGEVTGTSFIHKFGDAPDFDIGDGFVTVWDGAEDGTAWECMQYVFSTSAAIDSLSCSDAGDTVDIEIQGLDSNYGLVTQTLTLTGQARVPLTTNLIRVHRAKNVGSTDLVGHVFVYENDTLTGGVPDDPTLIRAIIHPQHNQTLMAVYTIPAGKTGYMRSWFAGTAGTVKTSAHEIHIAARPFGQVFQTKHVSSIIANGSSHLNHHYTEPEVFTEKTDIEIHVNTDTNAVAISGGFDIVLVDN